VLKPEYAYLMSNILSDDASRCTPQVCEFGRHSVLELPDRPAAAKTGTTDDYRANWTVGYTPSLVTAVWVGNSNHSPMQGVIGIDGAGPIWHNFMEAALKGKPAEQFVKPPNITTVRVSSITGLLPNAGEPSYDEVFVKGTEPKTRSSFVPTPSATLTAQQAEATATAVAAYATAYAQGTPLPNGVSLTPPAIPSPLPTQAPASAPPASSPPASARASGNAVPRVIVPNVVGQQLAQADNTLTASRLIAGALSFASTTANAAAGSVISQSPQAGQIVDSGAEVDLVVRR
jgi:membrane peptidoglycan carboxypeptidase